MRGYRVGIVNPQTPFGARVRQLLSEQELPAVELKLFETEMGDDATLTQFQDEVVVTQPFDADLLPALDVVFFSGQDTDVLNRVASEAAESDVVAIVEGAVGLDAEVVAPGLTGLKRGERPTGRLVVVPRMASYLVGAVVGRLHDAVGVAHASATVLVPAGIHGDRGAEELHQQVVNILNFKEPPMDVLHEQVAFNVDVAGSSASAAQLADAVTREASRLAGLDGTLTMNLVQVPVFHGFAASIWVELSSGADVRAIAACFREEPFTIETGRSAKSPSPISVAESARIHLGAIRRVESTRPGAWLWAVADTTAYDTGRAAIALAKAALE